MDSKRVSEIVNEHAANAVAAAKPRGRSVAISEEKVEDALERLAEGDTMRNVTADLGVTRSALFKRAAYDEAFSHRLDEALKIGSFAMIERGWSAVMGDEHSTGDIHRDKAIASFAQWYATRIDRRRFGDHVQHDVKAISIVVNKDDGDWFQ